MAGGSRKGQTGRPRPASKGRSSSKATRPGARSSKQSKEHRKFDDLTKSMREPVIKSCVDRYFKHVDDNGGSCKNGFVKGMLEDVQAMASGLNITLTDFNNALRREKNRRKKEAEGNAGQAAAAATAQVSDPTTTASSESPSSASRSTTASDSERPRPCPTFHRPQPAARSLDQNRLD